MNFDNERDIHLRSKNLHGKWPWRPYEFANPHTNRVFSFPREVGCKANNACFNGSTCLNDTYMSRSVKQHLVSMCYVVILSNFE